MFIELMDLLRCPVEHEDSWLVAAFTSMNGRFVTEGKLGCPVCSASYPITDGVAVFGVGAGAPVSAPAGRPEDDTLRIAAMLGLTRPGSVVVLEGGSADIASALGEIAECRIIAVNPARRIEESEHVGVVVAGSRMPLGAASVDGIVITAGGGQAVAEAARILRPGGRIVTGPGTEPGPRFNEIARDDRNIVAEKNPELIGLRRPG